MPLIWFRVFRSSFHMQRLLANDFTSLAGLLRIVTGLRQDNPVGICVAPLLAALLIPSYSSSNVEVALRLRVLLLLVEVASAESTSSMSSLGVFKHSSSRWLWIVLLLSIAYSVFQWYIYVLSLVRLFCRSTIVFLVFSGACLEEIVVPWYILESVAKNIFAVWLWTSSSDAVCPP